MILIFQNQWHLNFVKVGDLLPTILTDKWPCEICFSILCTFFYFFFFYIFVMYGITLSSISLSLLLLSFSLLLLLSLTSLLLFG